MVAKNGTVRYLTDDFKYLKPRLSWDEYDSIVNKSYMKNCQGMSFNEKVDLLFSLIEDSDFENMVGFVKVTSE